MSVPGSPRKGLWKGKEKANVDDEHFTDLNPTITYRHLLSNNFGVRDPFRVVALCDSDAFYAACEMVRLGVDKDTPLVVLQWDSLIAVNYSARKFGISRMDKKQDALKRCPHLQVVHVATYKEGAAEPGYWDNVDTNTHKVSLDYYRRESLRIAAKFKELLPASVEIEKASIDEAFFDFTKVVKERILERYPHLAHFPSDSPEGIDTPLPSPPSISWEGFGYLIPIHPPSPSQSESKEEQDLPSVPENYSSTWHDLALSIAADMMQKAREIVRTELGYSTSAGVARNKFLAKLCASYKKPNSQSILLNAAIPGYLKPFPFQKIRFLGGKLGTALASEFEASTVGDLLTINLGQFLRYEEKTNLNPGQDAMQHKFGEESIWIYEVLRGIDRNEVKSKGSALNKSMLASKNLPKPITKVSEGYHWIRVLAAELALRMNEARQAAPNIWPKTLVLHARRGYDSARSKQAAFPFARELTVDVIASAGDKLWNELVGNSTSLKVSSVQLAFTGIEESEAGQTSIEGFFKAPSAKRYRDAEAVIDSHDGDEGPSHTCVRCGRTFSCVTEDELEKTRLEHDDFHFAQDLAKESYQPITASSKPKVGAAKQPAAKKQKRVEGIERFFRK